jgi:hypothetical protein
MVNPEPPVFMVAERSKPKLAATREQVKFPPVLASCAYNPVY